MIKKIAFVGHTTRDMDATRKFYVDVLGLRVDTEHAGQWLELMADDGKALAFHSEFPQVPIEDRVYLALETDHIEDEVARLREAGAVIEKDVWDNQVCKMALVTDPSGHVLMLHQIAPDRT